MNCSFLSNFLLNPETFTQNCRNTPCMLPLKVCPQTLLALSRVKLGLIEIFSLSTVLNSGFKSMPIVQKKTWNPPPPKKLIWSIAFTASKPWNSLPDTLRSMKSLKNFKNAVRSIVNLQMLTRLSVVPENIHNCTEF